MIDAGRPDYPVRDLIRFAYDNTDAPEDLHTRFVNQVTTQHEALAVDLFWYWLVERVVVPDRELNKLMESSSLWPRTMTYAMFGRRCDEARVKVTLRKLSEMQKPIAAEQFTRLLAELDDDDFAIRERASRTLEILGERVKWQLRSSLDTPLSLEARNRLQRLLEQLNDDHSPLFSRVYPGVLLLAADALDLVGSCAPRKQEVLEAVTQGDPESPVTKLAREFLQKRPPAAAPRP